tara:strand:+ start:9154 stop:10665 length:1512 start_codon:yes stop_codon:yes gene_type:complete
MYHYNLSQKFDKVVESNLNKKALKFEKNEITYSALSKKSKSYADLLFNLGFKKGDVLCIVNRKKYESYAMMIACLKSGIAYVNLDEDNPLIRTKKIIDRCLPKGLFDDSNSNIFKKFCSENEILHLNTELEFTNESQRNANNISGIDGNTIAYIMFTSGSTGEPKGVAVTHQNLLHFTDWIATRYEIKSEDNFANLSPMYFDNSVFDFYGALFNGASLSPIPKNKMANSKELVQYVDDMKCTIWFSVPSLLIFLINMKVLSEEVLQNIRVFTFGGEGFPKSNLKKLYDIYNKTANIINVYGPTEGTCICSSYDISENDFIDMTELPSLGKINQNFSYKINKSGFKEENIGELILIGPNVAAGYYNFPEKTKEAFGTIKSGMHYLKRYYKTGDLVSENDDLLYFHGRIDNQIKHMGFRIELEEIENALNSFNYVNECAVVYKRINDSYGKIFAYLVVDKTSEEDKIKNQLKSLIPNYMIPNKFKFLEKLPKNANGKIDRKILLQ